MSNIPKDKFLKEFDKHQKENGMWGGRRYALSDAKKWKERQPLTEEQKLALEKRDKRGFLVLICGVSILFFGAILYCILQ